MPALFEPLQESGRVNFIREFARWIADNEPLLSGLAAQPSHGSSEPVAATPQVSCATQSTSQHSGAKLCHNKRFFDFENIDDSNELWLAGASRL